MDASSWSVIQIATLDKQSDRIIPRVRSQVFRTFFDPPTNPGFPLLLSSTDIRTPKVHQLNQDPVAEVVWWIDHAKLQFRIQSSIYVLPGPDHPLSAHFMNILANAGPETSLSQFKQNDWEQTRQTIFKSMSPHMKASWCRPTPGTILTGGEAEAGKWPKRLDDPDDAEDYEEAKRLWDWALSNFALVIVDPVEVDYVDLASVPNKRALFTKRKGNPGVWDEQALIP